MQCHFVYRILLHGVQLQFEIHVSKLLFFSNTHVLIVWITANMFFIIKLLRRGLRNTVFYNQYFIILKLSTIYYNPITEDFW